MTDIKPFHFELTDEECEQFARDAAGVLRSGKLVLGDHTAAFERAFADFVGTEHAVAVNSGSSALQFLMRIKGVTDKTVLVPTNTNFATVASVLRSGGKVRWLDMEKATFAPGLAMVEEAIASSDEPVAGVLWVHIGGVISPEFPAVVEHCRTQGIWVVEDAAHAHGSSLGGVRSGALADGAAFSFFATKVMTTCEGGMITTNDDQEAYLARSFRNQGKRGTDFGGLHHDFGDSSRLHEIGAVLGEIQLRRLPTMLERRARLYDRITAHLDRAGLDYVSTAPMDIASQYKLIVPLPPERRLADVKQELGAKGVFAGGGVYELPCHQQPVFEGMVPGAELPNADRWCPAHVCPPLTTGMSEDDADRVGATLVDVLTRG